MNCDEARATLHRLTGQTPHTPTPAEMRELAEPDAPPETHTRAAETRSDTDAGTGTSDARQAGRSAYTHFDVHADGTIVQNALDSLRIRPRVWHRCHGTTHNIDCDWTWRCDAPMPTDRVKHTNQRTYGTWRQAVQGALTHMRNEHSLVGMPRTDDLLGVWSDVRRAVDVDALVAAVRERHQPNPCDGGPVDLDDFTDDPAQAIWADAFDRAHNNPGGRS